MVIASPGLWAAMRMRRESLDNGIKIDAQSGEIATIFEEITAIFAKRLPALTRSREVRRNLRNPWRRRRKSGEIDKFAAAID